MFSICIDKPMFVGDNGDPDMSLSIRPGKTNVKSKSIWGVPEVVEFSSQDEARLALTSHRDETPECIETDMPTPDILEFYL